MPSGNLDDPIEITEGIFWIGFYDAIEHLHCNPYLLIDEQEAVLIDPGSIPDFPVIMRKIIDIINPGQISTIIVNHQDPDVCGNLPVVEDVIDRNDLKIVAHSTTHRLIYHYGIKSNIYEADNNDNRLTLKSGRVLEFVHTPYLHAPGAMMTLDTATGSLFTGDLFGSLSKEGSIYLDETFPESMNSWHQAVMPSGALLAGGMDIVEGLKPKRILPQHGCVIESDHIGTGIDHLRTLPCGYDLIKDSGK